ncbi:hypothetical protein D5272_07360 [bacterium D16-76]|nr:hypothetical protein [bacterium D16-76]
MGTVLTRPSRQTRPDETRAPKVYKPACDQKRAFSPETDIIPKKKMCWLGGKRLTEWAKGVKIATIDMKPQDGE